MPSKASTKADLERRKLEAEIAALDARREHFLAEAAYSRVVTAGHEWDLREDRAKAGRSRIYTFGGDVGEGSVQKCIATLDAWRRRDGKKRPITLVINSQGGSVRHGLALYDFLQGIRGQGTEVKTMGLGWVASMGGILFQAGTTRVMGRHAYMLIHEISAFDYGKTSEMEEQLKFIKKLQDRLLGILAERSTYTKSQIARRWKKTDWWLDADECLKLGFCDEIH